MTKAPAAGSLPDRGRVERQSPCGGGVALPKQSAPFTFGADCPNSALMSDALYFSRQQLCSLVGVDTILVGSWLRDDLLRSVDLEERKHRRFTRSEVTLAMFLREARNAHLNVSAMRALASKMRECIALYDKWPFSLEQVDDAQAMFLDSAMPADHEYDDGSERHWNAQLLRAKFPFDRYHEWRIGWGLWHRSGLLMVWQSPVGQWQIGDSFPQDGRLPAPSVTVFDIDRFASIDWPQQGATS